MQILEKLTQDSFLSVCKGDDINSYFNNQKHRHSSAETYTNLLRSKKAQPESSACATILQIF